MYSQLYCLCTSLDIGDVEKEMPGFLAATREWFKIYKMPTGKPPNSFAFNGDFKDKVCTYVIVFIELMVYIPIPQAFAVNIISQTNEQWKRLIQKQADSGPLNW